jgi:hypothetical protein
MGWKMFMARCGVRGCASKIFGPALLAKSGPEHYSLEERRFPRLFTDIRIEK